MVAVRLDHVSKTYGEHHAVKEVNLDVAEGEFISILGASGSGKTTCLRILGGFVAPSQGKVLFGDQDVTHFPPHRRDIGMVFQQYALFPHLTVAQNVAFGLKIRRLPGRESDARVAQALQLVRLETLAGRYPGQLSGGQKQRVALARAIAINPRLLLLDEPLGALDLKLREELQSEIRRIQQALKITTIFVTHDQNEALTMSDRIAVMHEGRIAQIASPDDIYNRPRSVYVAGFVGRTNLVAGTVAARDGDRIDVTHADGGLTVSAGRQDGAALHVGAPVTLAFRPEFVRFGGPANGTLPVRANQLTFTGEGWLLSGATRSGQDIIARIPVGAALPAVGETVHIDVPPQHILLLPGANLAHAEAA